jgi:CheY-like chemotaxis protein
MARGSLHGLKMLVVEDEAMVAMLVEDILIDLGCEVVGIAATVEQGLLLLATGRGRIDAAILDVNLGGEKVFPIADVLAQLGVPFIFASGYGRGGIEPRFADRLVLAKPFGQAAVAELLTAAIA